MANETRALAKFTSKLTYKEIPDWVRARATDILVDQIGCQIGCSGLPWAKQVRDVYLQPSGLSEATVVRYGDRVPVISAAIINSTFGHAFEFDDGNAFIHGHPGAELVAPLMAIAERDHLGGQEFLTAFVAAYEVRGHIGWALSPTMMEKGGPQYSTVCGPFSVAAGTAKLLGLNAEGICEAIAIAGTFSGGLMQYDEGGGSAKRIFCAVGASGGIQAAHLAKAGITGPEAILEGGRGLLRIYSSEFLPGRLTDGLGEKWTIEKSGFKPYSCCGCIQSAIEALKKITSAHALKANDVESIVVNYATSHYKHAAITAPRDLLGMQFSTSFSLALTALKGRNTPHEYSMENLVDPQIKEFAARIRIEEDAELGKLYPGCLPARVKVRTRSGDVREYLMPDAPGSPTAPLSSAEVDGKFRAQVGDILGADRCEHVLKTLRDVAVLDDVSKIFAMLSIK